MTYRILYVIARLNIGGTTPPVVNAITGLREQGHTVELVCGTVAPTEGDMTYYAIERGVTPIVIPGLGREIAPFNDLIALMRLLRVIWRLKPDLIHTHTAKAGLIGRLAAWIARVPALHTFHGHVFSGYFSARKTRFYLTLERLLARISRRLIAVSDQVRHDLASVYWIASPDRIITIPLGFPLDHLTDAHLRRTEFRSAYAIPGQAVVIGIVGRLVPIKNHAVLLESFALLVTDEPNAVLVIIGDGELRAELEAQTDALGIRDRVRFCGWIRDTALIFAGLDILALTSINEGLPVTIIEAMAAGVPTVATRVGGCAELLEASEDHPALGRLVEPGNAAAFAQALRDQIRDPIPADRSLLIRAARDKYGIGIHVERLQTLYRSVLESGS